jgi:hypothetical protein
MSRFQKNIISWLQLQRKCVKIKNNAELSQCDLKAEHSDESGRSENELKTLSYFLHQ